MLPTRLAVLFFAALLALVAPALAVDKVALVIGNSDYQHASKLPNPGNDARDLAAALEAIGFEVTLELDADFNAMRQALRTFSNKTEGVEVAMVYFAGHGIEIDKQNYLIPVDARLASDRDVNFEAISLDFVTEAVNGARKLKMVLLDACRNNPFVAQMKRSVTSTRSVGRGLTAPEPGGGTLIAYSAKGGTVAEDGAGKNSPFATALIDHISEPGLDVQFLFRRVRDDVLVATNNRQEPFVYGSLPGDSVYLVPPGEVVADTEEREPTPAPAQKEDQLAWDAIKDTVSPAILEAYLAEYPNSLYAKFAIARLAELRAPAPREDEPEEDKTDVADIDDDPVREPEPVQSCRATDGPYLVTNLPSHETLNIRSGRGTGYDILAELDPETTGLYVNQCRDGWCRIQYGCLSGFAAERYLSTASIARDDERESGYHVTGHKRGEELNVRSGPGTDYDILSTIPHNGRGVEVSYCETVANYDWQWCWITYRGNSGYAYARYLADSNGNIPN